MDKTNRLFIGSVVALITTAFGFIVRAVLITEWGTLFNLTETQKGALQGAGLFPFALSIILFSLIIDKIGYGRSMVIAWIGHVVSAIVTMTATSYQQLYLGTFLFALSNGVVEAVVNPVVASLYTKDKVRHLNILHSGWAGGFVLGGLLFMAIGGSPWQVKIGLFLIPAIIYGALMFGCKFPVNERVVAGIPYMDMLKEFGWGSCLVISYFSAAAIGAVAAGIFNSSIPSWLFWAITIIPTVLAAATLKKFGRPLFVFLLLVMVILATTELGTDSWVTDLLTPALAPKLGANAGLIVLMYTALVMTVLRLFAGGPLAKKLTPVGLLTAGSAVAALGLFMLANSGDAWFLILVAATLYGAGKSFFWPTTLGTVSEQFPKGGALTLNGVSGLGLLAVGVFGAPFLGTLQDQKLDVSVQAQLPALHQTVADPAQSVDVLPNIPLFQITFQPLDKDKIAALPADQADQINGVIAKNKQLTLNRFAVLPVIMTICFGLIALYFKSRGGYKPVDIGGAAPSEGVGEPAPTP